MASNESHKLYKGKFNQVYTFIMLNYWWQANLKSQKNTHSPV